MDNINSLHFMGGGHIKFGTVANENIRVESHDKEKKKNVSVKKTQGS